MIPESVAQAYHDATKYTQQNVNQPGGLDQSTEPRPFREVKGAERVSLVEASTGQAEGPEAEALGRLGRILYFTNGVTAVLRTPHGRMPMRAAPSAGALYPTEVYVVTRGFPGLLDGAWNYQVQEHALAQVSGAEAHGALVRACAEHPAAAAADAIVCLTGALARSAWRYKERGYRRVLLDTGHVLGNLCLYAPVEGRVAVPLGGFADAGVAQALDLADDPEEVALVVAPLVEPALAGDLGGYGRRGLRSGPPVRPGGGDDTIPSAVFFAAGEGTSTLHAQGVIREADLAFAAPPLGDVPFVERLSEPFALQRGVPLGGRGARIAGRERETIARRRSCRRLEGSAFLRLEQLEAMLTMAYAEDRPAGERAGSPGFFDLSLLETYVVAVAVRDLAPGVYYYAPQDAELRRIRRMDPGPHVGAAPGQEPRGLRDWLHRITLFQDLGRDASCAVFHVAALDRAVRRYGERSYRYLGLDAGHVGQRLNLAAVRLELGASGIGGYFDDDAATLLGVPPERAIVYLTLLGVPASG